MSEQDPAIARLENELELARRYAFRVSKEIHSIIATDLEAALAEARTETRRADTAEQQLAKLRASATWRAGRIVVAVPARIRRLVRRDRG